MASPCSTLLQEKFLHSSLFGDPGPMSFSASSNSTIEDEPSVHRSLRQYLGRAGSMDYQSSTHLANEARFSVDERLYLCAKLDEGGASVEHHRWQQTSPLVTLLSNVSQRSLRSVDSCPEIPRRGEDGPRIERTNSIDMASQFLARQERQTGPRDGGKSFYLNMVASNQNNSSSLDIDLYRPVGFNLNEIRRCRSVDPAPVNELNKPVGLPVGLDTGTQPVKIRRHSFDFAPSIPTRSAPDSPVSSPRSNASSAMADNANLIAFNQIMPAIQIAKEAQQSITRYGKRHMDDESTLSSEEAAEGASVVSSQESDIISDDRDLDNFDLDEDIVDRRSSTRWESLGEHSNNQAYDSGSESDLSDEDYRAVIKGKSRVDPQPQSRKGDLLGKQKESSIHHKPVENISGCFEQHLPSRMQMNHRARPRPRQARPSEQFTVNSYAGQENGKNKWRECLERSKAGRNERAIDHVHPRNTSIPPP